MNPDRHGLLAAGNFIVDHVKIIGAWPEQDMLATILTETRSNGGGPWNVLKNLARMQAGFPLEACGVVGDDPMGHWILEDCQQDGIDTRQLRLTHDRPTSYTDAMTVASTGRRTFFHQRGANALLQPGDCDFTRTRARFFHLAYLMLLDGLDTVLADGKTGAAHLLEQARQAGLETSVDLVSTPHPQFRAIATGAFPFTDHLMLNEVEAALVLERPVPPHDRAALLAAAQDLLAAGVRQSVTLHTAGGAVAATRGGLSCYQAAVRLPAGFSQGATGAGDAFAAGLLYARHIGQSVPDGLRLAVSAAACSLSHPTPSAGLRPAAECLALAARFGFAD